MGKKNRRSAADRERLIEKRRLKNQQADVERLEERVYDPSISELEQLSALVESYTVQRDTEAGRAVEQLRRLHDALTGTGWKLDLVSHEQILWAADTSTGERSISTNVLLSEPSVSFEGVEFAVDGAMVNTMDIVERVNRCYPDAEVVMQMATELQSSELHELEEQLPQGTDDKLGTGTTIGVPAQYQLTIPDSYRD